MKLYYTAILFGLLVALGFSHRFAYQAGRNEVNAETLTALKASRENETKAIEELENDKRERQVVFRDRIKVVTAAKDDSGCFDAPLPDAVLDSLLNDSGP